MQHLGLRLESSSQGMERKIMEPTVNRPGLALSGFYNYFASKRIQVIGAAEQSYLHSLAAALLARRLRCLFASNIPCLVVARGFEVSSLLLGEAQYHGTPVFCTNMVTMRFINAATIALEFEFAPTSAEHGSMVDILGVGVLIRGASGIGKSECVLGLIERGYSLVSDDITRIRFVEGRELVGMASDITKFHMEVRGIGIINVAAVFGIGSVRPEKRVDLVVTLKDWRELEDVDRIGLDVNFYDILGVKIPHIVLPVKMGRDMGRLVEVAALDQKLKSMGSNSAVEFNQRLLQIMSVHQAK
ncbi:MAG: HPr(Ser) kinase/phosphatase [Candidatus Xiphinematobacter sp.]|nr:MAG: HPr(Ser) kinase/phosphatase [Candidatus Xiphinematobacter sp.]